MKLDTHPEESAPKPIRKRLRSMGSTTPIPVATRLKPPTQLRYDRIRPANNDQLTLPMFNPPPQSASHQLAILAASITLFAACPSGMAQGKLLIQLDNPNSYKENFSPPKRGMETEQKPFVPADAVRPRSNIGSLLIRNFTWNQPRQPFLVGQILVPSALIETPTGYCLTIASHDGYYNSTNGYKGEEKKANAIFETRSGNTKEIAKYYRTDNVDVLIYNDKSCAPYAGGAIFPAAIGGSRGVDTLELRLAASDGLYKMNFVTREGKPTDKKLCDTIEKVDNFGSTISCLYRITGLAVEDLSRIEIWGIRDAKEQKIVSQNISISAAPP